MVMAYAPLTRKRKFTREAFIIAFDEEFPLIPKGATNKHEPGQHKRSTAEQTWLHPIT